MDKEHFEEEEQKWHSYLLQPVAWQLRVSPIIHTCRIRRAIALHSPDLSFQVLTAGGFFFNDFIFRISTPRNALYLFRLYGGEKNTALSSRCLNCFRWMPICDASKRQGCRMIRGLLVRKPSSLGEKLNRTC